MNYKLGKNCKFVCHRQIMQLLLKKQFSGDPSSTNPHLLGDPLPGNLSLPAILSSRQAGIDLYEIYADFAKASLEFIDPDPELSLLLILVDTHLESCRPCSPDSCTLMAYKSCEKSCRQENTQKI